MIIEKLGLGITESRISSFTKCVFTQIVSDLYRKNVSNTCHIQYAAIIIKFRENANKNAQVIDTVKAPIRMVNPRFL
jgi:hypothetical protein